MMKRLIYLSILLALLAGFASCQRDDLLPDPAEEVERTDNLPIRLEAFIADSPATRSLQQAKREFTATIKDLDPEKSVVGDVIHVESEFEMVDEQGNKAPKEKRYCALQLNENKQWQPIEGSMTSFAWPNLAVKGSFKAYYIHGSYSALTSNTGGSNTESSAAWRRFSDLSDGTDPLCADTMGFLYGHTVVLRFKHILTHLTVVELSAGLSEDLIFEQQRKKQESTEYERDPDFNNAFRISLQQGNDGPTLAFNYYRSEDEKDQYASLRIKAPTELVRDNFTKRESRQVGFFLEPDRVYNHFNLYYSSDGAQFLEYHNSDPTAERKLQANNRYTFDVKRSSGVTITSKAEEKWDESDDFTEIVDAEAFLKAVNSNSEYSEIHDGKEVPILERTENPAGTRLLLNVRFKNPYYHVFPQDNGTDFVPSVGADNVFDGSYHYIKDLRCPLFYENHGTIRNLGLVDVSIGEDPADSEQKYGVWESTYICEEGIPGNPAKESHDYSASGALATKNMITGTVQNIRIKNLTMKVGIHLNKEGEAHNAGALFGENRGDIAEVHLSGPIRITVQSGSGNFTDPRAYVGGLAGQNSGTMSEINQLVDNRTDLEEGHKPQPATISVTTNLNYALGAYYVGGLTGNNTGKLTDVSIPTTPNAITVDCEKSRGVASYLGGLAGNASGNNEISSCLIGSGTVKSGDIRTSGDIKDADAYTGGMVGLFNEQASIRNCYTFFSVYGLKNPNPDPGVRIATGGIFGQIAPLPQNATLGEIDALTAFGEELEGNEDVGCFAGHIPETKLWENYQSSVEVKKFAGIEYVGASKDL